MKLLQLTRLTLLIATGAVVTPAYATLPEFNSNQMSTMLCTPTSGPPESYKGSGACHGGNRISVPLDNLALGLSVFYSSFTKDNPHNDFDLGKNVSLSHVSSFNRSANSLRKGNGAIIPLAIQTTGIFNGSWLAVRRNELTHFFTTSMTNPNEVLQSTPDGTSIHFVRKSASDVFVMEKIIDRFAQMNEFRIGTQYQTEYLDYAGINRINVSRDEASKTITFTQQSSPFKTATIHLDSQNRLTKIVNGFRIDTFTYSDLTHLIKTHNTKSAVGNLTSDYTYDSSGRLVHIRSGNGSEIRFVRNMQQRFVESADISGKVLREYYDSKGRVISTRSYMIGAYDSPLNQSIINYNSNDYFSEIITPKGRTILTYDAHANWVVTQIDQYDDKGLLDNQIKSKVTSDYGMLLEQEFIDRLGKKVKHIRNTWTNTRPILLLEVSNLLAPIRPMTKLSHVGNSTTITSFSESGTKVKELRYEKSLLINVINFLLPEAIRNETYTYTAKGEIAKIVRGSTDLVNITYSTEGPREVRFSSGIQRNFENYNSEGIPLSITEVYRTGKSRTFTQEYTRNEDGGVSSYKIIERHPDNSLDTVTATFGDASVANQVQSIKLNGKEVLSQ